MNEPPKRRTLKGSGKRLEWTGALATPLRQAHGRVQVVFTDKGEVLHLRAARQAVNGDPHE